MAVLCPRCDVETDAGAAGDPCAKCGGRLVAVAVMTEAPDPLIGATIDGRFQILDRVGRGGMGTVYRAKQTSMNREVALKVIDRTLEKDAAAVKRFFREAQLASQLAHPNTVAVIEFGQDPTGPVYLVMELLRGETLSKLLQRTGALPLDRVVRIGVQMCDALAAALALGIVHRDLKPDNVIVLDGGRDHIKVLDFGLARSLLDPATNITAIGVIAGTPRYMAPEVALRGAAPAPAQDIYALGVVLGELATGRELWKAETLESLFFQKASDTSELADLDTPIAGLLRAMITADPTARPDASGVRTDLLALEAGGVVRTATPPAGVGVVTMQLGPIGAPLGEPIDAFGIALQDTAGALKQMAPSRLVALDTRPPPPPIKHKFGDGMDLPPGGPPAIDDPVANAPIVEYELAEPKALEIEADWRAQREVRQATPLPSPIAPRPPRARKWIAGLVFVGVIAGGVSIVLTFAKRHQTPAADPARPTVGIHVVAPEPVDVFIDKANVGKTPFTASWKRSTTPIIITATVDKHAVMRQVTPDRDQTVDLGADE
jgi:hypothetical protein